MNRLENERCRSALFNLGDNCSVLGKIACNPPPNPHLHPPMPITRRCTHLQHTHTNTHSSHPLSSYNPLAKPSLSMRTPHPAGPCQGKLEKRGGGVGGFCFEALCEKKKNPNHFLSWSNLTCCDNCSVRNFFDISVREDFLPQNQSSI